MYCITTDREMWTLKKRAARVMSRRVFDLGQKLADANAPTRGRSEKSSKADRYKRRAERIGSCAHAVSSRLCPDCNIRYIIGHGTPETSRKRFSSSPGAERAKTVTAEVGANNRPYVAFRAV